MAAIVPQLDFSSLGNLGKTYRDSRNEALRARAGQFVAAGDYAGATRVLAEAGDLGSVFTLAKLGREDAASREFSNLVGGGGLGALTPAAPMASNGNAPMADSGAGSNDLDRIVRTVYAEAGNEPPIGQQGVAAVIANRARQSGMPIGDVLTAKGQFEPWGNPATRARMEALEPSSPEYQRIAANVSPVLQGQVPEQFAKATHFYSPTAQAALGRNAPPWDDGTGRDVGRHRFFTHGYSGQGRHGIPDGRPLVANNEAGVQAAERATGMVPGLPPASPDMPALGAVQADGGAPTPSPADQARNRFMSSRIEGANHGGLSQRIPALTKAIALPGLPDNLRQLGLTYLKSAIDDVKAPEGVREFMWARGNGMTQARSPAEYEREKKGPTTLSPGQSIYDPATNTARYTAPAKEPAGFDTEAKLRSEVAPQLKTFNEVQDAYGRITSAVQQREGDPNTVSPASDIAIVFGFMKMLDPSSVVREGEYATAKNSGGVPDVVRNAYNKAINGEFLQPAQRQDMVDTAGRLYAQSRGQAEAVVGRYRGLAQQYGADPDRAAQLPAVIQAPTVGARRTKAQGANDGKADTPVIVSKPADLNGLSPGTVYQAPDGSLRRKQ